MTRPIVGDFKKSKTKKRKTKTCKQGLAGQKKNESSTKGAIKGGYSITSPSPLFCADCDEELLREKWNTLGVFIWNSQNHVI